MIGYEAQPSLAEDGYAVLRVFLEDFLEPAIKCKPC